MKLPLHLNLTSMALSTKKGGKMLLAFDAHNHIHMSKIGGIPPLAPLSRGQQGRGQGQGKGEDESSLTSLRRDDPNWVTFVDAVADSLHLHRHQHEGNTIHNRQEEGEVDDDEDDVNDDDDEKFVLGGLALMSTQPRDFEYVHGLAEEIQTRMFSGSGSFSNSDGHVHVHPHIDVVRCYGVHPWFLHQANEDFHQLVGKEGFPYSLNGNGDGGDDSDVNNDVNSSTIPWLPYLRHKISSDPSSQVGEIGLDGARYDPITKDLVSPLNVQVEAFEAQMHLAADLGKTVSVHAVRAWGPLMESMRRIKADRNKIRKELKQKRKAVSRRQMNNNNNNRHAQAQASAGSAMHESEQRKEQQQNAVSDEQDYFTLPPRIYFHAFGGKAAIVDQLDAICRGGGGSGAATASETFYGFAPVINFRSPKTASVIEKIGIDRLVLESDLEDHTGVMDDLKANVEYIAEALGMDEHEVLLRTSANAKRLYQLQ